MDCRFYLNGKRIKRAVCPNASEFKPFKTIIINSKKYMMMTVEVSYNAGIRTTIHLMRVEHISRQDIYDFEL